MTVSTGIRILGRFKAALTTLIGVGLAAVAAAGAEPWLDAQSLALFFVPPVIVVAIRHGFAAAAIAALISTAAVNFLFVEPRHTFVVGRIQDAAALAIFATVAALSSALAAQARAAQRAAEARASQAALLRDQALVLGAARAPEDVAKACCAALAQLADGAVVVAAPDDRVWGSPISDDTRLAARLAMSTKRPYTPTPDAPFDTRWRFWPVMAEGEAVLALGVVDPQGHGADSAAEQLASVAGLALARIAATQRAEMARIDAARERLKTDLLAGVSHDLRTPLSTILFTLQSLQRFAHSHDATTRTELIALAEEEARRLSAMVEALLDARRIGAEGVPVQVEPVAPGDLIARARAALAREDAPIALDVTLPEGLPLVAADIDLSVRALANVLSNAVRHGGGEVRITARRAGDLVCIDVRDSGPGVGEDPRRLFEPFHRGRRDDGRAPGLGLGLSLARTFLRAQGGDLTAENAEGGGAVLSARLPVDPEGRSDGA